MPRKTTASAASKQTAEKPEQVVEVAQDAPVEEKAKFTAKERVLEPHTLVSVRNGFNGKLVYRSSRTGERFVWDGFGSELDMELQDLRSAKNSAKGYFEKNWFMIDDIDVLKYLGVERMYRNSLSIDNFDEIFSLPQDKLKARLDVIPKGQRSSVVYRARQLINDGTIDSIKVIRTLEESLGVELIEK